MFSSRVRWDTSPNQLFTLLQEKQKKGEDVIDLTESNPTKCGLIYPEQEIISSVSDKSILQYQPNPRGLLSARSALSKYYEDQNVSIHPEDIFLTSTTSEAYSFLFKLLCDVNDEILAPQPSYPLFEYLCQLNDVKLRRYSLLYDGEWNIDFSSLERSINCKTKIIILIHPNNPTGSYIKNSEFEKICNLCNEKSIALIVDGVFNIYNLSSENCIINILSSSNSNLLFFLDGLSKLMALPQFKLSWIIIKGDVHQTKLVKEKLDIICDTYLSVNTITQVALPKLLTFSEKMKNQIISRIKSNKQFLENALSNSSISIYKIEGGWYVALKLPDLFKDDNLWAIKILAMTNVMVYPGHFFEFNDNSTIVISLLLETDNFKEAILRIKNLIHQF